MTEQKKYREFWVEENMLNELGAHDAYEVEDKNCLHVIEHAALKELEDKLKVAVAKCHELNKELNIKVRSENEQVSSSDLEKQIKGESDG